MVQNITMAQALAVKRRERVDAHRELLGLHTAMEVLCDINRDFGERGIRLRLAEVKGPVQDRLVSSPLWNALSGRVLLSANSAYKSLAVQASAPRSADSV